LAYRLWILSKSANYWWQKSLGCQLGECKIMDAVEFLKARDRICKFANCRDCFLTEVCDNFERHEEEVKLVEEWLKKNPELKSCPFCGGEARIEAELAFTSDNSYKIFCRNCFVETKGFMNLDEAVTAWNNRI
jgi:Lar family restriction alleviation protein